MWKSYKQKILIWQIQIQYKVIIIMKQNMLKSIKGFFNSNKPKTTSENKNGTRQEMQPRVINFGTTQKISKNQEQDVTASEIIPDTRYSSLEELATLKDLGLKKDQIQQGQIAVLSDKKFVFCKLYDGKYQETKFIITNYKICLYVADNDPLFFPLSKIDKLTKYTTNQSVYKLLIQLKDGRKFKFRINSEAIWKKIYDKIEMFAFIKSKTHFFSYRHFQFNKQVQQQFQGWRLYNPIAQFQRMGITLMDHTQQPITDYKSDFKILDNKDGRICSTYPAILVVPSRMPYDSLVRCARFRSKQRMPALSFAYEYEKGKFSAVYRSSQSKVGVQNSRSSDDELMLRMIGNHKLDIKNQSTNTNPVVNCKIYDARGFYAAFGNKISGKGYESEEFYVNCKLQFLNIPNIHVVRQAYLKTLDAAFGQDTKFYTALAESKWYQYIFLILYGALDLAKNLSNGMNCLVHCSDGWDRTSQLCALAGLILDPYYRTIKVMDQFWPSVCKKTRSRYEQPNELIKITSFSAIFRLHYSDYASFNYKYIQQIGEQAYSNLYGNFLCNCYFEMVKHGVREKTVSLWSKTKKFKNIYSNPFYAPAEKTLLGLDANEKNMRFWKQHFLQHIDAFKDVYGIYSCKFTEDNLQIIHRHLIQQKMLLEEKFADNQNKQIRQLQMKTNGHSQIREESPEKINHNQSKKFPQKSIQIGLQGVGLEQLIERQPTVLNQEKE